MIEHMHGTPFTVGLQRGRMWGLKDIAVMVSSTRLGNWFRLVPLNPLILKQSSRSCPIFNDLPCTKTTTKHGKNRQNEDFRKPFVFHKTPYFEGRERVGQKPVAEAPLGSGDFPSSSSRRAGLSKSQNTRIQTLSVSSSQVVPFKFPERLDGPPSKKFPWRAPLRGPSYGILSSKGPRFHGRVLVEDSWRGKEKKRACEHDFMPSLPLGGLGGDWQGLGPQEGPRDLRGLKTRSRPRGFDARGRFGRRLNQQASYPTGAPLPYSGGLLEALWGCVNSSAPVPSAGLSRVGGLYAV